mmetsp:Transcript_20479/g.50902  ORF Transcript_20479/g.50902 Transcript_20479/m.50902 type:complete len:574 (-) Transcript_20479:215-1936(-)
MPIDVAQLQTSCTNQEAIMIFEISGFSFNHDDSTFIEERMGETHGLEIVPLEMDLDGDEGAESRQSHEKWKVIGIQEHQRCVYVHSSDFKYTSLPACVLELTNLTHLGLQHSKITELPLWIDRLQNLKEIDLYKAQYLKKLPEEIGNLSKLESLDLGWTPRLESIPSSIGRLQNLKEIYLNKSVFWKELPDEMRNLTKLEKLNLFWTNLESFPSFIEDLTNLKVLDLGFTKFTSIPDTIGNLSNLEELNLESCQCVGLPDTIWNLSKLEKLDISGTETIGLPIAFGNLPSLKEFNMRRSRIAFLPDNIGNLSALKVLDLRQTEIEAIPPSIGELINLETLTVRYSFVGEGILPDSEIWNLTNLKSLDLSSVGIEGMPSSISTTLKNLVHLNVSKSPGLLALPEDIGHLVNLRCLNIRRTGIDSLPDSIEKLQRPWALHLSGSNVLDEQYDIISFLADLAHRYPTLMEMDNFLTDYQDRAQYRQTFERVAYELGCNRARYRKSIDSISTSPNIWPHAVERAKEAFHGKIDDLEMYTGVGELKQADAIHQVINLSRYSFFEMCVGRNERNVASMK